MKTIYRIKIQSGPDSGKEVLLDKPELFLGRDPNNEIVIMDPEVSRRHARFVLTGTDYSVEDLGSTNGTLVRGIRVQSLTPLTSGDIVAIGERVSLVYEVILVDPDATVAVPRHIGYRPEPLHVETPEQKLAEVESPQSQPVQTPLDAAPAVKQPEPITPVVTPPFIEEPDLESKPTLIEEPILPQESSFAGKTPVQPKTPRKRSPWVGILLIVGLLLLIFCVIPWIIIDITNSYCLFLPGILNAIQPGVCP